MKTWILILLPLLFLGCNDRDKVVTPEEGGGGNGNPNVVSNGLMPLSVGNWWEYCYTNGDTAVDFRRMVVGFRPLGQHEYYLLADSNYENGRVDTLCYMRNDHDGGLMVIEFPTDTLREDTLMMYPHVRAHNYCFFKQDCVLVLVDPPGGAEGAGMWYQRFRGSDHHDPICTYKLARDSSGLVEQVNSEPNINSFSLVRSHIHY